MMRSLFAGVSGIRTHQVRMDVIGNNIANINTIGFKGGRAVFSDVLSQTLSGATGPTGVRGGTNAVQVGLGAGTAGVDMIMSQGNLESTGLVTDLALTGDGFFVLRDGLRQTYTRAGSFQFDSAGTLVNPHNGFVVQGYLADSDGSVSPGTGLKDLKLPFAQSVAASATSKVNYRGNLNSDSDPLGTIQQSARMFAAGSAATGTTLLTALTNAEGVNSGIVATDNITITGNVGGTPQTPVTLAVTATSTVADLMAAIESAYGLTAGSASINANGQIVVTGAKGKTNEITNVSITAKDTGGTVDRLVFNTLNVFTPTQTARDAGVHTATIPVYDSLGGTHTVNLTFTKVDGKNEWTWAASVDGNASVLSGGTGRAFFRQDGSLDSFTYDGGATSLSLDPGNTAISPISISLDFGKTGEFTGLTQFKSPFNAVASNQNGFANGTLDNISIDQFGKITGRFTNGVLKTLAQIALANFTNSAGLQSEGGSNFVKSLNSGDALVGIPGAGVQGNIVSGALEQSNVDLALQFTDMIIAQRGFQAATRVIRNADDLLQEVVNIKR